MAPLGEADLKQRYGLSTSLARSCSEPLARPATDPGRSRGARQHSRPASTPGMSHAAAAQRSDGGVGAVASTGSPVARPSTEPGRQRTRAPCGTNARAASAGSVPSKRKLSSGLSLEELKRITFCQTPPKAQGSPKAQALVDHFPDPDGAPPFQEQGLRPWSPADPFSPTPVENAIFHPQSPVKAQTHGHVSTGQQVYQEITVPKEITNQESGGGVILSSSSSSWPPKVPEENQIAKWQIEVTPPPRSANSKQLVTRHSMPDNDLTQDSWRQKSPKNSDKLAFKKAATDAPRRPEGQRVGVHGHMAMAKETKDGNDTERVLQLSSTSAQSTTTSQEMTPFPESPSSSTGLNQSSSMASTEKPKGVTLSPEHERLRRSLQRHADQIRAEHRESCADSFPSTQPFADRRIGKKIRVPRALPIKGKTHRVPYAGGKGLDEKERERKNPFVMYEDKEKKLQEKRKWLKEDAFYLENQIADLRLGRVFRVLDQRFSIADTEYEDRVYFSSFAMKMKAWRVWKDEMQKLKQESKAKAKSAAFINKLGRLEKNRNEQQVGNFAAGMASQEKKEENLFGSAVENAASSVFNKLQGVSAAMVRLKEAKERAGVQIEYKNVLKAEQERKKAEVDIEAQAAEERRQVGERLKEKPEEKTAEEKLPEKKSHNKEKEKSAGAKRLYLLKHQLLESHRKLESVSGHKDNSGEAFGAQAQKMFARFRKPTGTGSKESVAGSGQRGAIDMSAGGIGFYTESMYVAGAVEEKKATESTTPQMDFVRGLKGAFRRQSAGGEGGGLFGKSNSSF